MRKAQSNQKVTTSHLSRDAYLYIRQSSLKQVFENSESTKRQYALRDRAIALGWPSDRVFTIDSDLGQSGTSSHDRLGFQKLVADVGLGKVGIVLGLEVSRLARNSSDWHALIEICVLSKTLILDEDGIYDPTLFNDRLLLGLKGTMSEAEIHVLMDRLQGGLLNKARRAELEIPIPTGFIYTAQGKVEKDPDIQVQGSLSELFAVFRRLGSATATAKFFNSNGIKFPQKIRTGSHRGELHWGKLRNSNALRILHNPRYAGAYAFGRTQTVRTLSGTLKVRRLPREEWEVLIEGAHDSYLSMSDFNLNQSQLKQNAVALGMDRRRPPREGPALLQGLVLCARCGKRMTLRYHVRSGKRVPDYLCQSHAIEHGERICQSINGSNIDKFISKVVVDHCTPEAIKFALKIEEEIGQKSDEVSQMLKNEVQRAKYEAQLAERRFLQVDPENRLVASTLEASWNEKLRSLSEAEDAIRTQSGKIKTPDPQERNGLMSISKDFSKIWNAPQTTDRDRKRLVTMLLEDVTLLRIKDGVELKIRFKGGATEQHTVALPSPAWILQRTDDSVTQRIDELLRTHNEREIAEILNNEGLTTGRGYIFKKWTVQRLVESRGLKTRYERLRQAGLKTSEEIMKKYKISSGTFRTWYRNGLVKVHYYDERNRFLCEDLGKQMPILKGTHWEPAEDKDFHRRTSKH